MKKAIIGGVLLLPCLAILARGVPAAGSQPESLLFVFLSVDRHRDIAILRPMIAPDIGVQLDSGPRSLTNGTVLTCQMVERQHDSIVEGQLSKVGELVLDCGDHKFVIKTLDFSPQRH